MNLIPFRLRQTLYGGAILLAVVSPPIAVGLPVEVAASPNNSLSLTLKAIGSAKKYLLVNAYELTSDEIATALVNAIDSGVHVEVLEEGQPVGGFSANAKRVQKKIVDAMESRTTHAENRYFLMKAETVKDRRFHFNHAKYMVVDNESLLIGSENYSETGNPVAGHKGNRGWEVFIEDKKIASGFETMFVKDASLDHGDVTEITSRKKNDGMFDWLIATDLTPTLFSVKQAPAPVLRTEIFDADEISRITSPDNSLKELTALLGRARKSIDLELMTFSLNWGASTKHSPVYDAVVAAARRGVKVRALLNDEHVFGGGAEKKTKNETTVKSLNALATKEDLDLEAAIAQVKKMGISYIHNKGAIIDGDTTLISSINWNENSIEKNREAGVVIKSEAVNAYYAKLFDSDWELGRK